MKQINSAYIYASTNKDLILCLSGTTSKDQQLFCKQIRSDLSVTLRSVNVTFPIHSFRVRNHSGWFRKNALERNLIITENFKVQDLQKVLSLFYGFHFKLQRENVAKYYNIVSFLQVQQITRLIEADIYNNLSQYDLFVVLQLAHRYRLQQIIQLCLNQLLKEEFQQMQYSLFDLLRCPEEVFRIVISYHNKMRSEKKTNGFTWQQIQEIIKQYSDINKLPMSNTTKLLHQLVDHKQLFLEESKNRASKYQTENIPRNQNNKARKMSESIITEAFIVKSPQTPVRNATTHSQFLQSSKTQNSKFHNQNFHKKSTLNQFLEQPKPRHFLNNSCSSNDGSNIGEISGEKSPYFKIEVNQHQQFKRYQSLQDNQINQSPFQRTITQTRIDANEKNYLTIKINTATPRSSDNKQTSFKVWENNKLKRSSNKISITDQKKIFNRAQFEQEKKILLKPQNMVQSRYKQVRVSNNDDGSHSQRALYSLKQLKQRQQLQSTDSLQQIKIQDKKDLTQSKINGNDQSIQITNRPRVKTAIESKVRRNTSYFGEIKLIDKKQIKQKSELMKEIQDFNIESEKIKNNSKKMLEQVKKLNEVAIKKQRQNIVYKQNLTKIQKMLKNLQQQFGQKHIAFTSLEQKVQNIYKSIKIQNL